MPDEKKSGAISYTAVAMLKKRGLVTHFLAFVTVFCEDEASAQGKVDRYLTWAIGQPEVPAYKKQPTQKQWIEKFRAEVKDLPEFLLKGNSNV
jgi:hypothetical protein